MVSIPSCGGLHVAASEFMKVVAFGVHAVKEYEVGFKMLLFNPLVYVVPTGRVKVPAGRYVVPTGKDNVIVSTGRSNVIPAGSTILIMLLLITKASTTTLPKRQDLSKAGPTKGSRFQKDPNVSYLEVVKRIFRYVKKQTSLANFITESDYVAAGRACEQALWIKQAFVDYNIMLNEVPILCDNKCTINLTSSPIDYALTKQIEIRHHFLKDDVAKKHITIDKIILEGNVANILTIPLEKDQFNHFILGLGLMLQEEKEEEKKGQDVIEECTLNY
ncbi:hypothetical protein Tco_0374647 [Tanacetum coccineum]